MTMGQECTKVTYISEAARILYENFIADKMYSPIDKLAMATSPQAVLYALYEILRGIRNHEDRNRLDYVVRAITDNLQREECVEEALILAKRLAARSMTYSEYKEKRGKPEEEKGEEE